MNPCQICGVRAPGADQVRYGRHTAHFACYLEADKPLAALPAREVSRFPALLLARHGLFAEAVRLAEPARPLIHAR